MRKGPVPRRVLMYPETMLMIFTLLREQEEADEAPRRPPSRPWMPL